jgi:Protein of unknown function (DUF3297)
MPKSPPKTPHKTPPKTPLKSSPKSSSKSPPKSPPKSPHDSPPDRLSNDPSSPYYDAEALKHDVGIRFQGVEKTNVSEYCVSEGWIRAEVGKTKDRYGNPLTIKLTGPVEAFYKNEKKR